MVGWIHGCASCGYSGQTLSIMVLLTPASLPAPRSRPWGVGRKLERSKYLPNARIRHAAKCSATLSRVTSATAQLHHHGELAPPPPPRTTWLTLCCLIPSITSRPGKKFPCSTIILIILVPFSTPQNVSRIRTRFKPFNNWSQMLTVLGCWSILRLPLQPSKNDLANEFHYALCLFTWLHQHKQELWLFLLSLWIGKPHLSDIFGNRPIHRIDLYKLIFPLPVT